MMFVKVYIYRCSKLVFGSRSERMSIISKGYKIMVGIECVILW